MARLLLSWNTTQLDFNVGKLETSKNLGDGDAI